MALRRFILWALLNGFVFRPVVRQLNESTYDSWRCRNGLNASALRVIVASPGRSGTTSIYEALRVLGLRTYKDVEVVHYMPELLEPVPAAVGPAFQACGVEAFVAAPLRYLVDTLVTEVPNLRVVGLRPRPWREWRKSYKSMLKPGWSTRFDDFLDAQNLHCHWWPHRLLLLGRKDTGDLFMSSGLVSTIVAACHGAKGVGRLSGPARWRYRDLGLEELRLIYNESAYEDYHAQVRALVPPERWLELDIHVHGLAELAAFLGLKAPNAGPKFVRVRAGKQGNAFNLWLAHKFPAAYVCFWAMTFAAVALNWHLFNLGLRRLTWRAEGLIQKRE